MKVAKEDFLIIFMVSNQENIGVAHNPRVITAHKKLILLSDGYAHLMPQDVLMVGLRQVNMRLNVTKILAEQ